MDPAMKELGETPRDLKVRPMNCTRQKEKKEFTENTGQN
jgi:hypothetical protein